MKSIKAYWHTLRQRFREPGRKKKTYVFLLCLLCSAFFWLFIKLSREAQMVFEQPLVITNVSSDVVVSQLSHERVSYTVQTNGARLLLSRYAKPYDSLRVDAGTLGKVTRNGKLWHYVSPGQLRSRLSERLDASSQLVGIWPDTVFVSLAYAAQKRLPVRPDATYTFERRFGQYGPVALNPDSVTVRGPRQLIDTLQAIYTEPLTFELLAETVQQPVALMNPAFGQGLTLEVNQAELIIPVEEFTETSVDLNIEVVCPQEAGQGQRNLRLFPNRVTVTCLVSLKDYARLEASQFKAHVVCPSGNPDNTDRLEVIVETFPEFVSIQSIRPSSVEFLIIE
ncbi:MAG: YbbR-like domain-containing protein [Bacteroides sp.]|jgi:hypothetical protein|nr:YbbR-like domain-containing protein [Bacteroides sp.]